MELYQKEKLFAIEFNDGVTWTTFLGWCDSWEQGRKMILDNYEDPYRQGYILWNEKGVRPFQFDPD